MSISSHEDKEIIWACFHKTLIANLTVIIVCKNIFPNNVSNFHQTTMLNLCSILECILPHLPRNTPTASMYTSYSCLLWLIRNTSGLINRFLIMLCISSLTFNNGLFDMCCILSKTGSEIGTEFWFHRAGLIKWSESLLKISLRRKFE